VVRAHRPQSNFVGHGKPYGLKHHVNQGLKLTRLTWRVDGLIPKVILELDK